MIAVGVVLSVIAVAVLLVSVLALSRNLPGNKFIGIRVAEVRKDKEVWDAAHHVAGALWLVAGVALGFGALTAFIASGWLWLLPVLTVLVAIAAIGAGANAGARTAAAMDVRKELAEQQAHEAPAPQPEVNIDAVRRAAGASKDTRSK